MSVFVEGMGVATGMAFDSEDNLYVGDRSGTIFKISPNRQIFVFATLEPSIAAYHLAFGPDGYLYVTGPTTSSFDCVYRISDQRRSGGVLPRPGPSAGHGVRRGRPLVRGRFDYRGARAWCASSRTGRPSCSSPAPASSAWRSRPRARWWWPPPTRSIAWTSESRGSTSGPMNAEIIAVGSEMLTPERVDTNSLYLTAELNNLGVEVVTKCVIGDDRERLADAVRRAVSRSEIVILSGGLGPTEDDLTREAVALALDRKLVFHEEHRRCAGAALRRSEAQDGGDQQAPGVRDRRRGRSAQRSRHRARPVGGGVRRRDHAAARSAARTEACSSGNACRAWSASCRRWRSARCFCASPAWRNRTWIS